MNERIQHMELLLEQELGPAWELRVLNQVESTMDIARALLPLGNKTSALVLAMKQVAGRGRQGRLWRPAGDGLYVTLLWQAPSQISRLSGFSLVAGCVLREALASLGAEVKLKWPNDILSIDGRKLSGTLIELVNHSGTNFILCGIGVNLRDAPGPISTAVSLFDLCAKTISPLEIVGRIAPQLTKALELFLSGGFKLFVEDWNSHAFGIDQECQLELGDRVVSGILKGVDSEGRIVIQSGNNTEAFAAGQLIGAPYRNDAFIGSGSC